MSRAKARKAPESSSPDAGVTELSFEAALAQLEDVVQRLERGELTLEESLSAYERGVRLVHHARGNLDHMHARLEELLQDGSTRVIKVGKSKAERDAEQAAEDDRSDHDNDNDDDDDDDDDDSDDVDGDDGEEGDDE